MCIDDFLSPTATVPPPVKSIVTISWFLSVILPEWSLPSVIFTFIYIKFYIIEDRGGGTKPYISRVIVLERKI